MALAPYYTGDNVPLKFNCYDGESPATPTSAVVTVVKRNPDKIMVEDVTATISSNEVSYAVPTTATPIDGKYTAFFALTMPGGLSRTHAIDFEVIANPD